MYHVVADPPSISAFDLDVVKLTAQFVARNGRQFLTNLMNRELPRTSGIRILFSQGVAGGN